MRKATWIIVLANFFFCSVIAQLPASEQADTLFHDFETGELFGWEQYPYAQDIGFDALYFARESPTLNHSRYALSHPVKAYDTHELYQGFTRRLNMTAVKESILEMGIYLQSDRDAKELELSFGTTDGQRYFHRIANPVANQWLLLKIPLSEFRNGRGSELSNKSLEAISIQASYDTIYYLNTYTILMDNFRLTGTKAIRLQGKMPSSSYFAAFDKTMINQQFSLGEKIALTVETSSAVNMQNLSGKLYDPTGKLIRSGITFKQLADGWQNNAIYQITPKDQPGIWQLQLTGNAGTVDSIRTRMEILVINNATPGHPRLFINKDELAARKKNSPSPAAEKILQKALLDTSYLSIAIDSIDEGEDRTKENLVGGPYAQNTVGFDAYAKWHKPMSVLEKVIETTSFRYSLVGDEKAGAIGKAALLKFCRFKKWNANWMLSRQFWTYYPVGYAIKSVAYGYDMLYDLLSEEERKEVRMAMLEKGIKLFHRDMVEMNRMPSNLTNHIAVLVTGVGLAAAAMYGDDADNKSMEPWLGGILTKARAFMENTYYPDGSYGEPKSGYMDMATRDLAELIAGLEHVFGIDFSNTTDVENFYKYPLYASDDHGLIQSYGDGSRAYSGFTQEHAQWFVYRNGNPYLYKYVKPFWEAGNGGFLGYIWYRDDIKPIDRNTLPGSKLFSAQGMLMRSGWDSNATVISTRTGPHSNHYHFDQGSFQVMTNGEELLTDPGIGTGGYYMNTEFLSYNTQSIAHNVLLIDHDPGSQVAAHFDNGIKSFSDWPTMTSSFNGKAFDAVTAELSSVYKGKLDSYQRKISYRKNGPIFLLDELRSKKGEPHYFDWLFHVPQKKMERALSYNGNRLLVEQEKARLTMDILLPAALESSIRDRSGNTNTYLNYNSKYFSESFLTLSTLKALDESRFLAVIYPEANTGAGYKDLPVSTALTGDGWLGARVQQSGYTDEAYFRTDADTGKSIAGIITDAKLLMLSTAPGKTEPLIYVEGSRFMGKGWAVRFSGGVAAELNKEMSTIQLEWEAKTGGTLLLTLSTKPKRVLVNGKLLKQTTYVKEQLQVQYDAGKTILLLP